MIAGKRSKKREQPHRPARKVTPTGQVIDDMTLPDKLRIGIYEYAVSEASDLRNGEKGVWGLISHQHHTIEIEKDTPLRHKQYLIWHEALHSMLVQAGLHGIDLEEPIVIALGHALVGVVRNNPGLIAYTLEDAEPPPADKT